MSDNWRWIKLSHAYPRIGSGTTPPDELSNYMDDGSGTNWVTTSELRESCISQTKKQVSNDALKRYPTLRVYRPGSVLFAMYGATIGRLGVLDQPACCNQACCVFENSKAVSNRYLVYWLQHRRSDLVALSVGGGQPNLSQQDLRNERVYCPHLATQRQIADFLDRETARIDLLIEKKQRLVALLGEKAASEIDLLIDASHPRYADAPPEYSERTNYKLKMLCSRLGNGFVGPTRDILVDEDDADAVPYLQSTHVKNRRIEFQRKPYFVTKQWLDTKRKAQVQQDDLVIVQTGDCGATAIVDEEFHGTGCHAMIITRPKPDRILPRYLLQVLCSRSGREMLAAIQTGALHPHLEVGFVKDVSIPTPPRSVQDEILRWIESELHLLECIQEKTQTSIDRLKEYRSALITAAVTGQIDVSTYAKSGTSDRRLDAIQEEMEA